jgi:hypothetical protein
LTGEGFIYNDDLFIVFMNFSPQLIALGEYLAGEFGDMTLT